MSRKASLVIGSISLFLLPVVAPLNAQDEQKGGKQSEATVTEDYLLELQSSYLLNLMVYSDDPVEKRLAIQRLEQLITMGKFSQNDAMAINRLIWLGLQGTAQRSYDLNGNLTNDNFAIRADACNLLGKLGGDIAQSGLLLIMIGDPEPTIVAMAMENLLRINHGGSPTLIGIIVNTFYKYHYTNRDNNLASSFILVASQYAANSGGRLLSPNLLQAIHEISLPSNAYMTVIRTKARALVLSWIGADYPIFNTIE